MTSSPGLASSSFPSMVTVTVDFGGASDMGRLLGFDGEGDVDRPTGDASFELVAEPADGADHRRYSRRTERADGRLAGREGHGRYAGLFPTGRGVGTGADVVSDVEQQIDVG